MKQLLVIDQAVVVNTNERIRKFNNYTPPIAHIAKRNISPENGDMPTVHVECRNNQSRPKTSGVLLPIITK